VLKVPLNPKQTDLVPDCSNQGTLEEAQVGLPVEKLYQQGLKY